VSIVKLAVDLVREPYKLLGIRIEGRKEIFKVSCPKGHEFEISRTKWGSGNRCPVCRNSKSLDNKRNIIKEFFSKEGYTLLSEYSDALTKLEYVCPEGHKGSIRWDHFRDGYRCGICTKGSHVDPEYIKDLLESERYKVVSINKLKWDYELRLVCPNNHNITMRWLTLKKGKRCYVCDGRVSKINYDIVKNSFEEEGYELLSTSYINSGSYLYYRCPEGHEGKIIWSNWNKGIRCGQCKHDSMKVTDTVINNILRGTNKTYLSKRYDNVKSPLVTLRCECGEEFEVRFRNIRRTGPRCPSCDKYHSKNEDEIYNFIFAYYPDTLRNRWDILNSRNEIDIVIPENKLCVEYCGLYYHTELSGKREKNYHLDKLLKANQGGYNLITIFEDEYLLKKELVLNMLLRKINKFNGFKIYARDCYIKEVSSESANLFLDKYHIQGKGHSTKKVGAYFGDYLVALMTFSNGNISKGTKNKDKTFWELDRFAVHSDFCVVGVGSKLLSYFEKKYDHTVIISYADRRWSTGNLYYKLGFELDGFTRPNYWYTKDYKTRIHRFALRKNKEDDQGITEWENRKSQGYDRIWDCGNMKFIKRNL